MKIDLLIEEIISEAKEKKSLSFSDIIKKAKNKQLGVKIEQNVLNGISDGSNLFNISKLYDAAIKQKADPEVAIGFLLSHLRDTDDAKDAIETGAPIQYALNFKKDWFKKSEEENHSFMEKIKDYAFNKNKWTDWAKNVKTESSKHGSIAKMHKGGVDPIYKDDTWELYSPNTFEDERRIAYYGPNWMKETHWCTRAQEHWFNGYSKDRNERLWIVRKNNGHTWQLAFNPNTGHIEFMDEYDTRPKDTTNLSVLFPDEITKKIHDRNGTTLYSILGKGETKKIYTTGNIEKTEVKNNILYIKYEGDLSDIDTFLKKTLKNYGPQLNFDSFKFTPISKTVEMSPINNIKISYEKTGNSNSSQSKDIDTSYSSFLRKNNLNIDDYGKETFISKVNKPQKAGFSFAFVAFRSKDHTKVSIACFKTKQEFLSGNPSFVCGVKGNALPTVRKFYNEHKNGNGDSIPSAREEKNSELYKKIIEVSPYNVAKKVIEEINEKYEKVLNQLGFGHFTVYNNTRKGTLEDPYDFDYTKYYPIKVKDKIFNIKGFGFEKCGVKILKNKFVVSWGEDSYSKISVFEPGSKEYNVLNSIKGDFIKLMYKYTKDYYEQYKRQREEKQLEQDHENWKNGMPHVRNEIPVREEIDYFKY